MALDGGVAGGVARSQLVRDACPREEAPRRSAWWQNRERSGPHGRNRGGKPFPGAGGVRTP